MAWFQIRFQADAAQVDTLEELLLEQGALAVTLEDAADQPILEPELGTMPVWDKTQVVGLFDAKLNSQTVVEQLAQQYKQALPTHK
ncbi:MAG TPA: 50S ribosomal protein L11 methyltransferase, partial [Pseudomonadales bacterium]|nr:50S ribosomal protein L11 methyltransferase [Pseudomonadales bacterium]